MVLLFLAVKLIAFFLLSVIARRFLLKKFHPFHDRTKISWEKKVGERRLRLLGFALSDLRELVFAVVLLLLSYQLADQGFFTGPYILIDHYGEPSMLVLWLVDKSLPSLLACFFLGVVLGLVFRNFGFSIPLAVAFIFPSFISAPGAALLVFGDLASVWFRSKGYTRREVFLRGSSAVVSLILFWILGGFLRFIWQGFGLDPFRPLHHLLQSVYLLGVLIGFDTLLSMFIFHFYYAWTKAEPKRI